MVIQTWSDILISSLQTLWGGLIAVLPSIIAALIVLIVGWLVAIGLGKIAEKIIAALRVDQLLEKMGVRRWFDRAGLPMHSGRFVGALVKWFFIIVVVLAAADILRLTEVSVFLRDVVFYIPNIIVAVIILLIAVLLANIFESAVRSSVAAAGVKEAKALGAITRWVVLVFGFLAALSQLGISAFLINTLITGLVAMLALAGGLAFGLGGKDHAARFLEKIREQISRHSM